MSKAEQPTPQLRVLLEEYDRLDREAAERAEAKRNAEDAREHVKGLLRDEATNMGLGKGSRAVYEGLGTFGWTTKRYWRLPSEHREQFVRLLIERGEEALLTIGQKDLNAWCDDMEARGEELPSYLKYHEDRFVPQISLESAKARRAEKQREKAARKSGE